MRKPNNYENTSTGESRRLPAGGYICTVVSCTETKSRAGRPMLKIELEIAEGDFKGWFNEIWTERRMAKFPDEVKYPHEGASYIVTEDNDGNCSRSFKQFCTALEDSGAIVWNGDELADLTGAVVGVIFRREEGEYNGKRYWQTKPMAYRSVDTIRQGKFTVPEDKPLAEPEQYPGFTAVSDDCPF